VKQICVSFSRIGVSDAEAPLSEALSEALFDALAADRPIAMVVGSPVSRVKAFCDDGDTSQDAADALALGIYTATGIAAGFHASEIDSTGVITELTDPVIP